MKTLIGNYNLNYSELKQALDKINLNRAFLITGVVLGALVAYYLFDELSLIMVPVAIAMFVAYGAINNAIDRITVDFDLSEIVEDMKADWR
jgi:lipoprotein signal peptidase